MLRLLLNESEVQVLNKSEEINREEMLSWKLPNLYYPLFAIAASMLSFLMFKNSDQITTIAFVNLVLNGSIPMVALNRLSSLGVNLFKFDKSKEKEKSNRDTTNLRIKIHYYSQGLVFSIALFYIFQVIRTPFTLSFCTLLQLLLSYVCIDQSLRVSKYAFLLQEKLIDTTYDKDIRKEILEKGHSKNWE